MKRKAPGTADESAMFLTYPVTFTLKLSMHASVKISRRVSKMHRTSGQLETLSFDFKRFCRELEDIPPISGDYSLHQGSVFYYFAAAYL